MWFKSIQVNIDSYEHKNVSLLVLAILMVLANNKVFANTEVVLQCHYDPGYAGIGSSSNAVKWQRTKVMYISPYTLLHNIRKQTASDLTIIDTRIQRSFDEYHIKGAFNLPFSSLKTKTIFRNKKIVLVGSGNDYKYLEKLLKELAGLGFGQVLILDGGIKYWRVKIESKKLMSKDYQLFNIDKLLTSNDSSWKIIDTSNNNKIVEQFPNVISIAEDKNILSPASYVKSFNTRSGLINNLLLVLTEKYNTKEIADLWQSELKANIYVIQADKMSTALSQHYSQQRLLSYKKRSDGSKVTCPN